MRLTEKKPGSNSEYSIDFSGWKVWRRLLSPILMVLLLCLFSFSAGADALTAAPEAQAQMRSAENIDWAGGSFVLLDGSLIDLRSGETVLSSVNQICPWGDGILALTEDRCLYTIAPDGACVLLFAPPDTFDREYGMNWLCNGVALLEDGSSFYCASQKYGAVSALDFGNHRTDYYDTDIILDQRTGDSLIIYSDNNTAMVSHENGNLLWKRDVHLVYNHMLNFDTQGLLSAYIWDERISMTLDPATGETITRFPDGWIWRSYDGQCQIYEDHTALMDFMPADEQTKRKYWNAVVSLSGDFLIQSDQSILDRMPEDPYKVELEEGGGSGRYLCWDVHSPVPELIVTGPDGEVLSRTPVESADQIPGVVFDPKALLDISTQDFPFPRTDIAIESGVSGIGIVKPDGTLLGGEKWKGFIPFTSMDGVEYNNATRFAMAGWLPVMNFSDQWGILSYDGHMILPAEYDSISSADYCFVARKGGETEIYDRDLHLVVTTR